MDLKFFLKFEKNYKITKCQYKQECVAYLTWNNVCMLYKQNLSTEILEKTPVKVKIKKI